MFIYLVKLCLFNPVANLRLNWRASYSTGVSSVLDMLWIRLDLPTSFHVLLLQRERNLFFNLEMCELLIEVISVRIVSAV